MYRGPKRLGCTVFEEMSASSTRCVGENEGGGGRRGAEGGGGRGGEGGGGKEGGRKAGGRGSGD